MKITADELESAARRIKLALSEEERQGFTQQLNKILDSFEQLKELNAEDVPPMVRLLPLENMFREDVVGESLSNEQVLSNTVEKEDGYFKVPKIID